MQLDVFEQAPKIRAIDSYSTKKASSFAELDYLRSEGALAGL